MACGYVMQEQPFSVNDGDGIRSTIFLAGCPLRCAWCSNPEGQAAKPLVGYYAANCTGCGKCAEVCPQGVSIDLNAEGQREQCTGCGRCAEACPTHARRVLVSCKDAEEIIAAAAKYEVFYRSSGGGITFSGGEPTAQYELLDELSRAFYDRAYSLAIETSGYFDIEKVRPVLKRMDLIFLDIKHMDDAKHRKYTGVSNRRILENAARLRELSAEVVVRIPLICGVNADEENVWRTAAFVKENLPEASMELLPYHKLGELKYQAIGKELPPESFAAPEPAEVEALEEMIRGIGVRVVRYR